MPHYDINNEDIALFLRVYFCCLTLIVIVKNAELELATNKSWFAIPQQRSPSCQKSFDCRHFREFFSDPSDVKAAFVAVKPKS